MSGYKSGVEFPKTPEQIEAERGEALKRYQEKAAEITANIQVKADELAALDAQIQEKKTRIREMLDTEDSIATRMENLNKEIEAAFAKEKAEFETDKKTAEDALQEQEEALNSRHAHLVQVEATLGAREQAARVEADRLARMATSLQSKETELGAALKSAKEENDKALALKNQLSSQVALNEDRQRVLTEKTQTLERDIGETQKTKKMFSDLADDLRAQKAEYEKLHDEAKSMKAAAEAKEKELMSAKEQQDQMARDLEAFKNNLDRREQMIAAREKLHKEK